MDLSSYMTEKSRLIEAKLDELFPEKNVPHNSLYQAARYALLGGGKRLRPILTLAAAETLGGDIQTALVPACALELIHTYSLIHDDLPCMDDDDFRRGKPSLHKAFPEGHAVLAGDFLLTHAFSLLAEAPQLSPEQKVRLIATLSSYAGGEGMIGGQVMDLEAEGKQIDLEHLRLIHQKKTGAMITASLEFGGIVSSCSQRHMDTLRQFGLEIGLAFQIVDDVLDVTASKQKHGKKVASDLTNDKSTYVTVLGLEESKRFADQLHRSAIYSLQQLPGDISLLKGLAELIVKQI